MAVSEKNILQEYCQKNQLEFPVYTTRSEGQPHQLLWYATLYLDLGYTKILIETTVPTTSKTAAEKVAARLMLDKIQTMTENMINKTTNTPPVIIQKTVPKIITEPGIENNGTSAIYLIDLENKPYFSKKLSERNIYIGFISATHHSVPKYANWRRCQTANLQLELQFPEPTLKLIYLVEGGLSNLVDHFLSFFTYPLIEFVGSLTVKPSVIKIVSGDNAGWCSRICLNQALEWKGLTEIKVKNIAHDD